MSVKVMSHVWENSPQKGSALLLLLAIADFADDDGRNAYPSRKTLARKTRMTERNVSLLLRQLERDGELHCLPELSRYGTQAYEVLGIPNTVKTALRGEKFGT